MAWDDTPPTAAELAKIAPARWDATPPTKEEMAKIAAPATTSRQGGGLYMPPKDGPQSTLQKMISGGKDTLSALGKAAGALRATTTGPLTGEAIQALTGKKVYSNDDIANAVNPTNLKQFPSNSEMMARAGMSNPSLSDVVPGYAKPGSKWYLPEKGGMLDPSLGGAAQAITDPSMYLGMGEAALAAKGLPMAAKTVGMVDSVANPLSLLTKKLGKVAYESPLLPLEQQAARKGKDSVAQTLYEGKVTNPRNLPADAQGVVDNLMDQRDQILNQAGQAGGVASMETAVAPLKAKIAAIRATQDPAQQAIADKMQARLDEYLAVEKGTPGAPGSPARTETVSSPILDANGQPYTSTVDIPASPGAPGVAPKAVTPLEASGYKTSIYKTQPKTHYNMAGQSDLESELDGLLAKGQLNASQDAVEGSLGKLQADKVRELNQKAGGLLSTQGAQTTIAERAGRQAKALTEVSPADVITAMAGGAAGNGSGHTLEGIVGAVALKKLASALNQSSMPIGYYTRKLGGSTALDRLNEVLQEQKQKGQK